MVGHQRCPAVRNQAQQPPPLERSRFGGSGRRQGRSFDDSAPVSRSDLSRGPQELLEHRKARVNFSVLVISSIVILAFSVWAIFMPSNARTSMKAAVDWIALSLGWYYVVTMALVIGFVVWVALSKEGAVRLGPGLPQGLALQIALVIGAVVLTVGATTSGVDRGIRWISELNLWSALAMMLYILVTGQTAFLLNALVENIGRFVFTLPERMMQTFAYEPDGANWMGGWTLFFWAFWLAWGPFVGVFLARISRGRTLREFVVAAITAPVLCDFIIVSLFGNSALFHVLQGNTEFAELAIRSPEQGWYSLLAMFPGAMFLIGLATLSGLLFYLTSANSGAMVMSNFSASIPDPSHDGPKWLRVFWALLTAVLTITMLLAGGVTTMEYATLIFALPVTIIAYLVMASFHKVLRMERAEREGEVLRRRSMAPIVAMFRRGPGGSVLSSCARSRACSKSASFWTGRCGLRWMM